MPEGFRKVTTSIVLLGLVAVWGAYLAVWWRDNHAGTARRADMIRTFNRGLDSLGATATNGVGGLGRSTSLMPRSAGEAAQRRRLVMACLGGLAATTLLLSLVLGTTVFLANLVIDAAFAWYCYEVVQRRNLEAEREMKVTLLRAGASEVNHASEYDNVVDLRAPVNA